jgi:hypothetical protein
MERQSLNISKRCVIAFPVVVPDYIQVPYCKHCEYSGCYVESELSLTSCPCNDTRVEKKFRSHWRGGRKKQCQAMLVL